MHRNVVLQDSEVVLQDSDVVLQDSEVVLQDSYVVLQDSDVVLQESNVVLQNRILALQVSEGCPVAHSDANKTTDCEMTKVPNVPWRGRCARYPTILRCSRVRRICANT